MKHNKNELCESKVKAIQRICTNELPDPHEDAWEALEMMKMANRPPLTDDQIADIESIDDGTDEDRYDSDLSDMIEDFIEGFSFDEGSN